MSILACNWECRYCKQQFVDRPRTCWRCGCGEFDDTCTARERYEAESKRTKARNKAWFESARQDGAILLFPAYDIPGEWIAHDKTTDVVTQGMSPPHALEMLIEAVDIYNTDEEGSCSRCGFVECACMKNIRDPPIDFDD